MTNFSLVSIPFCLMVADTMGIANLFPPFYLCICIVGIILAVIIARIPPIKTIPNTYRESVGKQINEEIPAGKRHFCPCCGNELQKERNPSMQRQSEQVGWKF